MNLNGVVLNISIGGMNPLLFRQRCGDHVTFLRLLGVTQLGLLTVSLNQTWRIKNFIKLNEILVQLKPYKRVYYSLYNHI